MGVTAAACLVDAWAQYRDGLARSHRGDAQAVPLLRAAHHRFVAVNDPHGTLPCAAALVLTGQLLSNFRDFTEWLARAGARHRGRLRGQPDSPKQAGCTAPGGALWPWPLRIYALGRFALQRDGITLAVEGKAQKKPLELLRVLVAHGATQAGQGADVRELVELLWPDLEANAPKASFDMTLMRLRKLLQVEGEPHCPPICTSTATHLRVRVLAIR